MKHSLTRTLLVTFIGLTLCASSSLADVTLTHRGSEVWIDSSSSVGTYYWNVDNRSQLFQQWWWYRVGETGTAKSIDTLDRSGNLSESSRMYEEVFSGDDFSFELTYLLTGGLAGSGRGDLAESISVINGTGQTIYLFQYSDFDLDDDGMEDTVRLANANTWHQKSGTGLTFSETVATPAPTAFEAGIFNDTVWNLENIDGYTLNNFGGPLTGDVTWAWQWNITGTSMLISKDKNLWAVPAPGAAVLGMLGLSLVGALRRRLS